MTSLREGMRTLKRRVAAQHAGDREAYTDAKADFVADALRHAARRGAVYLAAAVPDVRCASDRGWLIGLNMRA